MTEEYPVEKRKPSSQIIAIQKRLDENEHDMKTLKENQVIIINSIQQISDNTQPFLAIYKDLESGTRFLCRCAMGVRFILEMIKSYYMPVVILCTFIFVITHNYQLPHWFNAAIQAVE